MRMHLKIVIFKVMSRVDILSISCEIALRWMLQDFPNDKSTLVQVMAWCRQATSHYLSQCWPSSISPYGIARPQWVKPWLITTTTIWKLQPHQYQHKSCVIMSKSIKLVEQNLQPKFKLNLSTFTESALTLVSQKLHIISYHITARTAGHL